MTPPANRFARWLPALGLAVWAAGAVLLWVLGRQWKWSPGELVLAGAGWVLVLALLAREPVRNLFGPVFWYEVTRVGRRFTTFLFRFLYVLLVCGLLTMLYLSWRSRGSGGDDLQFHLLLLGAMAALLGLMCLAWWKKWPPVVYVLAVVALLVLVALGWWQETSRRADVIAPQQLASFATGFYQVFSIVQFTVVVLMTPAYVAGAITDEKERKTIDYLFTTDLANREIVFGKLAARLANVVFFVLAGLPVIAFLQLFGGIDPDLALAGTAATLVTAVGLAAVGIALSAAARRSREAIFASYGLVLLYLFTSTLFALIGRGLSAQGYTTIDLGGTVFDLADLLDWYAAGNAVYVVPFVTQGGNVFDATAIGGALGRYAAFWGVVSALALGWAVTRLRRVALHQSYGGEKKKRANRLSNTRPEMGDHPLVWREVFAADRRQGCFGLMFRAVIILFVGVMPVWGAWEVFFRERWYRSNQTFTQLWDQYGEGMNYWVRISTGVLSFLIFLGAAMRGASAVAGEKDRDTWVSLCTSPISVNQFLLAKWLGAVLSMRFALWVLVGIWAVGLGLGAYWWFLLPVVLLYLFTFTSAFALAGIWCSITAKKALTANVRAFFLALFLAGGFWLVLVLCCVLPLSFGGVGGPRTSELFILPLGMTPPVVTGILPIRSFERYDVGPFHPREGALAPFAPLFGLAFWVVLNYILFLRVRAGLTREMNRGRIRPEEPTRRPREAAPDDPADSAD